MQVYTGSYRSKKNEVVGTSSTSIREGQLVAVFCEDSSSEPWIGTCLSANKDTIRLSWLKGTYSSAWKPWKKRSGRQMISWEDVIPTSSVILYDFDLTKTQHLQKSTVAHLKQAYDSLRTCISDD